MGPAQPPRRFVTTALLTMRRPFKTAIALIQVARPVLALAAVSNIWLVVLWQAMVERTGPAATLGLARALGLAAGAAVGLHVFGACLNDVLDLRRDRLFAPHRPIPSRRVTLTHVTVTALAALLLSLFCAVGLGRLSVMVALGCAALILGYDAAGKHLPAVGLLLLGLIRVTLMAVGGPALGFVWPMWLDMTHVIVVAGLVHRLQRKRPYLASPELWIVAAGWTFLTLGMIVWMAERGALAPEGMPWLWTGPIAAGVVALGAGAAVLRWRPSDAWAGQVLWRGGVAWMIVYDGSWFLASGQWRAAAMFGGLGLLLLVAIRGDAWVRLVSDRSELYRVDRGTG